jgi:hypothetical protein
MALFRLVFMVVALILIGVAIVVGLVACGLAALLVGAGVVSSFGRDRTGQPEFIGWYSRFFASVRNFCWHTRGHSLCLARAFHLSNLRRWLSGIPLYNHPAEALGRERRKTS